MPSAMKVKVTPKECFIIELERPFRKSERITFPIKSEQSVFESMFVVLTGD